MWGTRPFVRILLFFLSGIALAVKLPFLQSQTALLFYFIAGVSTVLLGVVITFLKSFSWRWLTGLIAAVAIMATGMGTTLLHLQEQNSAFLQQKTGTYAGEIVSEPQPTRKTVKFILKPLYHKSLPVAPSKIMTFLKKDSGALALRMGDRVVVQGKLTPPAAPKNPNEFDYAFYLKTQGIGHLLFAGEGWQRLSSGKRNTIRTQFARWRNYLLNTLEQNGLSGEEYGVAAAILLGNDQVLDPDVEHNYVAAGAVHILCVSGMHVGIIFLVLNYLLGFSNKMKRGKILKNLLLFLLLWSYALLTGLSPSVLRATVMISFFILANALQRDYDSYNLLAASAFFLLLFQPFLLFHVGFQLSYTAVLGILTFYYPLYRSIYIRNKIIQAFWAALMVSLSAQLGAFPIAAHYFHVFPVYFLLTNVVIFILSYLILSSGFALLVLSWIPWLPKFIGWFLSFVIGILNRWVNIVAHLPFSQLQDLYFPWIKVVFIYALILSVFFLVYRKKGTLLLPALVSVLALLSLHTWRNTQLQAQNHVIVYSVNRHTAIGFINGRNQVLLTDSLAASQPELLAYNTEGHRINSGLHNEVRPLTDNFKNHHLLFQKGFVQYGRQRLYILNSDEKYYPALHPRLPLDVLIYRGRKYIPLQQLTQSFDFDTLILDNTVPQWVKAKLISDTKALGIKLLDTYSEGAVLLK